MADPTPCAHERITTASADGLPSLWYCDDCSRRFYPACETCVDVGHRNETHPTLDAERALPAADTLAALREAVEQWAELVDAYRRGEDLGPIIDRHAAITSERVRAALAAAPTPEAPEWEPLVGNDQLPDGWGEGYHLERPMPGPATREQPR